jgi:hypothetical protein
MQSIRRAATHGSHSPSRFDANRWRGQVCRFSSYRSHYTPNGTEWEDLEEPEPGDSCSYSDFIPDGEGHYFLSDFLSGSDYSGCLVERANYRDFLADFGERDGVHEAYGGHGTFAVAVRIDAIDDEMTAVLDALEDYPLISEETHGEMELEAQDEAWESWAESDFVRELEGRFGEDAFAELVYAPDGEPEGQSRLFETGERRPPADLADAVRQLFETARETANEYWIDETGGNAWIDLDRVCDAIDGDMLAAHCLKVEG